MLLGCATACTHPCRLERPRDPPDFEAYRPSQAGQPLEVFWTAATLVWPSPLPAATCGHSLPRDTIGGVSQDFHFASFTCVNKFPAGGGFRHSSYRYLIDFLPHIFTVYLHTASRFSYFFVCPGSLFAFAPVSADYADAADDRGHDDL